MAGHGRLTHRIEHDPKRRALDRSGVIWMAASHGGRYRNRGRTSMHDRGIERDRPELSASPHDVERTPAADGARPFHRGSSDVHHRGEPRAALPRRRRPHGADRQSTSLGSVGALLGSGNGCPSTDRRVSALGHIVALSSSPGAAQGSSRSTISRGSAVEGCFTWFSQTGRDASPHKLSTGAVTGPSERPP